MSSGSPLNEECIARFEQAWTAGEAPEIDDCLPPNDDESYLGTLQELVIINIEFRWKQPRGAVDVETLVVPAGPSFDGCPTDSSIYPTQMRCGDSSVRSH